MHRRIISMVIAVMLILSLSVPVFAEARINAVTPTISFSGTTANCSVTISAIDKNINANLELWCNGSMVNSWSGRGQSLVIINGSHYGISGREYIVKVTGTIGSETISCYPVSAVCP